VYTEDTNSFDHVVLMTEQKLFVFSMNACKDVHIFLTHLPGIVDNFAYQILLGTTDNTRSLIRKMPEGKEQEFNTANILPCNDLGKSMWITWSDGVIVVGNGADIGVDQLFSWNDDQPYSINSFALASRDTKPVFWDFLRESGRFLRRFIINESALCYRLMYVCMSVCMFVCMYRCNEMYCDETANFANIPFGTNILLDNRNRAAKQCRKFPPF
jgi:hypothetical protein